MSKQHGGTESVSTQGMALAVPAGMGVYFIYDSCADAVKIGQAGDPLERLRILQIGNPTKLELLTWIDPADERLWHYGFAHARLRGEWFDMRELESVIEALPGYEPPERLEQPPKRHPYLPYQQQLKQPYNGLSYYEPLIKELLAEIRKTQR